MIIRSLLIGVSLALFPPIVSVDTNAAPLILESASFYSALNWTHSYHRSGNDVRSLVAFQSNGGNPGDSLRVFTYFAAVPPAADSWLLQAYLYYHVTISPHEAEIGSVNFSLDTKLIEGSPQGIEVGVALRQGNVLFVNRLALDNSSEWITRNQIGLNCNDFVALAPSISGDGFDPNLQPDFSRNGSPIIFGLYNRHSAASVPQTSYVIDNWRVQVNFVPEPSADVMASLTPLALAALRRRK